eukprot:2465140-Prymnesium_polylepis.1
MVAGRRDKGRKRSSYAAHTRSLQHPGGCRDEVMEKQLFLAKMAQNWAILISNPQFSSALRAD